MTTLEKAFKEILESFLVDVDIVRGMSSPYCIPEHTIDTIVNVLLREVQIRVYIDITK